MRVNAGFTVAASELVVQTSRRFTALTLPFICWLAVQSCPVQMFLGLGRAAHHHAVGQARAATEVEYLTSGTKLINLN
jgi:hypothetical protein